MNTPIVQKKASAVTAACKAAVASLSNIDKQITKQRTSMSAADDL